MKKAHTHALWMYGVIVGLAIRESLTHTMPYVIPEVVPSPPASSPVPLRTSLLIGFRLVLFLALIVRFYFGAAKYFSEKHDLDDKDIREPDDLARKRAFGMDFLIGLFHFLIFFAWSYTITAQVRKGPFSWFLVLMITVLLYDLLWWLICRGFETGPYIKVWMLMNLFTALCWLAVFAGLMLLQIRVETAEMASFIPVALMTIVDFGDMISGRNRAASWVKKNIDGQATGASA
jgi:hypothetical protein